MNRLCFIAVIFGTGLYGHAQAQFGRTTTAVGTASRSIVTQTSAGVSAPGGAANPVLGQGTSGATTFITPTTPTSLVTPITPTATVTVTPATTLANGTVVTPSATTFVTPTTGIQTGSATPLTAVPTQTGGTIVSGTVTDPSLVPPLKNKVNIFGQIVGTEVNPVAVAASANGIGTTVGGTVVGGTVGGVTPQQLALARSVVPGNTQVTIMLQGTVASQADRQAVLNRFQGLPGFVVVDQLQVAGTTVTPTVQAAQTVNAVDVSSPQSIFVGGTTP